MLPCIATTRIAAVEKILIVMVAIIVVLDHPAHLEYRVLRVMDSGTEKDWGCFGWLSGLV